MLEEVWKDVPDWEGYYQVSNFGRVKSLKRRMVVSDKIMVPVRSGSKYETILFSKNGDSFGYNVHRLVAKCFLNNYSDSLDVDHINGERFDNYIENLRMCSRSENLCNRIKYSGSSRYKGVSFVSKRNLWRTQINKEGKVLFDDFFLTEEEAAIAYDKVAIESFGEFAKTNKMLGLLDY